MCATWIEHRWSEPKFLTSGRNPWRGRFQMFTVRCENARC